MDASDMQHGGAFVPDEDVYAQDVYAQEEEPYGAMIERWRRTSLRVLLDTLDGEAANAARILKTINPASAPLTPARKAMLILATAWEREKKNAPRRVCLTQAWPGATQRVLHDVETWEMVDGPSQLAELIETAIENNWHIVERPSDWGGGALG